MVDNPCKILERMYLPRHTRLTVNCIRTEQVRCGHLLHKWKYRDAFARLWGDQVNNGSHSDGVPKNTFSLRPDWYPQCHHRRDQI